MHKRLIPQAAFTSLVGRIVSGQKSLTDDLQQAAVVAIGYANMHGDVRPGQQLLDAIGKTVRADAMLKFLEVHGKFAWLKTEKKLAYFADNKDAVNFDDDAAYELLCNTPWNTAKKAPELKSQYDVDDMFVRFMAATRATIKKAQAAGITVKNMDLLDALTSTGVHYEEQREAALAKVRKLSPAAIERLELEQDWDTAILMNTEYDDVKAAILRERINEGKVEVVVPGLSLAA